MPQACTQGLDRLCRALQFLTQFQGNGMVFLTGRPGGTGGAWKIAERLGEWIRHRLVFFWNKNRQMWKAGGEFLKLMGQGIETLRCAPGIDRGFGAVQDTVDDSRDCRRRTFRDAPARSKHRDHGAFLAFAPILPKDDPPPARELDDASRGEKVEARRDVRRFVSPDRAAMRFVPSELVEELPLGNPIRTDPRAIRFHLAMELVHFLFQDLGPLIELKLGEALGENRLDLIERMRL